MIARKRLLSLPLQVEISPKNKYDDVTKDPHFLWSVKKVSTNGKKSWAVKKCLTWSVKPKQNLSRGILSESPIMPSNKGDLEYLANKKDNFALIRKALFKSPHVLERSLRSKKLKLPKNTEESGASASSKKNPPTRRTVFSKKDHNSVIFLEEIITLDDAGLDSLGEAPTEPPNHEMKSSEKIVSPKHQEYIKKRLEYNEYLRLKLKYEGKKKNYTEEEIEIIDL